MAQFSNHTLDSTMSEYGYAQNVDKQVTIPFLRDRHQQLTFYQKKTTRALHETLLATWEINSLLAIAMSHNAMLVCEQLQLHGFRWGAFGSSLKCRSEREDLFFWRTSKAQYYLVWSHRYFNLSTPILLTGNLSDTYVLCFGEMQLPGPTKVPEPLPMYKFFCIGKLRHVHYNY